MFPFQINSFARSTIFYRINRKILQLSERPTKNIVATGIFAETHFDPASALSDGPNMIPLNKLKDALIDVLRIREVLNNQLSLA